MKTSKFLLGFILLLGIGSLTYGQIKNDKPIERGIYFILNGNQAIEPLGPTLGNNVFLKKYNKSGMQKWEVIPQKDGSYLIRLYETELYLEPHPAGERTAWLDTSRSGYKIEADENSDTNWYIKSKARKGDAMKSYSDGTFREIRFESAQDDKKFKWEFVKTD